MASFSFGFCLRIAFVSMLAVWLSGCGLPPALTIISSLADGISFAANGKSLSDVALSAITEQDCAVYRIVTNKDVCREATSDQSPAIALVSSEFSSDATIERAVADGASDGSFIVRPGELALMAAATDLTTNHAMLDGFADGTELFALVQDDGALEVFSHVSAHANDRSNIRLIVRISGYSSAPAKFRSLLLNGTSIAVEDIIV